MFRRLSYGVNTLANFQVRLCQVFIAVLASVMTIVILLQVFFRFVVYVPFPQSEELARFLMIWMAMFGSVIALRKGRHIGVRVLVERLPSGIYDHFVVPLVQLVMIGFLAIMVWQGWDLSVRNAYRVSTALDISMRWPYLAIPMGSLMMLIDVVADFFQDRFPTAAGSSANIASQVLAPAEVQACPADAGDSPDSDNAAQAKD